MKAIKVKKSNLLRVERIGVGSAVNELRFYRTIKSAKRAASMLATIHKKKLSGISEFTPIDRRKKTGFYFAVYK